MVRQKTVAEGAEVVWGQDPCLSSCKALGGTHSTIWEITLPHSLPCGRHACCNEHPKCSDVGSHCFAGKGKYN